jgi:hypothetical protein
MRLTIGGVLVGVAVVAASFWATLAVVDYFAAPPSPVAPGSTATPSAPVTPGIKSAGSQSGTELE